MRFVKPRKPRGYKKDGSRSEDMCEHCIALGCDPMGMSREFRQKTYKRSEAGVCRSCGANPCKCKSRLGIRVPIMVIGGSRDGIVKR